MSGAGRRCHHCGFKTDELIPQISFMNKGRNRILSGQFVKVCRDCFEDNMNFLRERILPKKSPSPKNCHLGKPGINSDAEKLTAARAARRDA